jgi:hypothetical protein
MLSSLALNGSAPVSLAPKDFVWHVLLTGLALLDGFQHPHMDIAS